MYDIRKSVVFISISHAPLKNFPLMSRLEKLESNQLYWSLCIDEKENFCFSRYLVSVICIQRMLWSSQKRSLQIQNSTNVQTTPHHLLPKASGNYTVFPGISSSEQQLAKISTTVAVSSGVQKKRTLFQLNIHFFISENYVRFRN